MGAAEGTEHDAVRRVLRALADLSPAADASEAALVVPTEWFHWLPLYAVRLFYRPDLDPATAAQLQLPVPIERELGDRLAAVDQIRPEERNLRVGWLFVAGTVPDEQGRHRKVFRPLVTVPVRVQRGGPMVASKLVAAGDTQVTELVADRLVAYGLERQLEYGGGAFAGLDAAEAPDALLGRLPRLHSFAVELAAAAGFEVSGVVPVRDGPDRLTARRSHGDRLRVVAGVGIYVTHETGGTSRAGSLRAWADGPIRVRTAFHHVYDGGHEEGRPPPATRRGDGPVESPYPLTPAQRRTIVRSRTHPVTVVSGAPGTGKSHTVTAIALDALARGESVLVTAKSDATVDALLDLLEEAPGPDPVVFGSNERRDALAARLAGGQAQVVDADALARARAQADDAVAERDRRWQAIAQGLLAEASLDAPPDAEDAARRVAPRLFEPPVDLDEATALATSAGGRGGGPWARWRRRRANRRLRALTGAAVEADVDEVARAIGPARLAATRRDLLASGGLRLDDAWTGLARADAAAREAVARWLAADSRSASRLNRQTLPVVAALATGLRSGRAARREQLRRMDDDRLTRALPLWIGSLPDIDDLLPPIAGLFDLVIVDEATSIDQPSAAPALLRGRRAVIVGDPRQLRHVSFLSDGQLARTMTVHGLDDPALVSTLDVRRNSAFDVAAGVAPVQVLDEHFRAAPHLVSFVFGHLYGGEVTVATRRPTNDHLDCIEVVRLAGHRNEGGVVEAEVRRVVRELKSMHRDGRRSAGVVTPFRAQADAIEAAVIRELGVAAIEDLDLRIGTVHAFQGNERDHVLVSLGVGEGATAASWRFVDDPHLFAVLATRARQSLRVVLSGAPPEDGLLAAYLAQDDAPPSAPRPVAALPPWAASVADGLQSAGLAVRRSYPTGRHVLDVCLVDAVRTDVAVECGVHPDGADAHIERHLALRRSGWRLLGAHRSAWDGRRGELVVELLRSLGGER